MTNTDTLVTTYKETEIYLDPDTGTFYAGLPSGEHRGAKRLQAPTLRQLKALIDKQHSEKPIRAILVSGDKYKPQVIQLTGVAKPGGRLSPTWRNEHGRIYRTGYQDYIIPYSKAVLGDLAALHEQQVTLGVQSARLHSEAGHAHPNERDWQRLVEADEAARELELPLDEDLTL